jgi:hypothetical protein
MNAHPFATSGAESVNVSGAPDFTNVFTCLNMGLVLLLLSNDTSLFFFLVLWCPLQFPSKNDIQFVFNPICRYSCFIYDLVV